MITLDTYYTFIYCFAHDDGYIIKSHHIFKDYDIIECGKKPCNWANIGILKLKNNNIIEIKKISTNYDQYGGFKFRFFLYNLSDDNGTELDINEHKLLYNYILHLNSEE
jgi:hypothetical protein